MALPCTFGRRAKQRRLCRRGCEKSGRTLCLERGRGPRVHALSRRGMGCAGARRSRALRVPRARISPSRVELVDDPAQARRLSARIRRFRCDQGGAVHAAHGREAHAGREHRAQSAEDRSGRSRTRAAFSPSRKSSAPSIVTSGSSSAASPSSTAGASTSDVPPTSKESDALSKDLKGARLQVRRLDDRLCAHAGDGAHQRPPRRLFSLPRVAAPAGR